MTDLDLATAQKIVASALAEARKKKMLPLSVVVLDERGSVRAVASEDGTSLRRYEIAYGKGYGVLVFGLGARELEKRATARPHFFTGVSAAAPGMAIVPVAGGVLIKNATGHVVGAVGVSGETSDNDEVAALAGIAAAGLKGDTGAYTSGLSW
jgi:uncharacterized protein GlcG (DUF336 family)